MGSVVSSDKLFVCGRESLNCTPNEGAVTVADIPTVKQEVPPVIIPVNRLPMDVIGFPFPPYANGFVGSSSHFDDVVPYPPSPLRDIHESNAYPHYIGRPLTQQELETIDKEHTRICSSRMGRPISDQEFDLLDRECQRRYSVDPSICPSRMGRPMSDQELDMMDREFERRYAVHPSICPSYKPIPNGVCRAVPLQGNETMNDCDSTNYNSPFTCVNDISPEDYNAQVKSALSSKFPKKKRSRKQRRHNTKNVHVFLDPVTDPRVEQFITDEYDRESFKSFMANFKANCSNAQSYNQIYESVLSKYNKPKEEIIILDSSTTKSKEELDEELDAYMSKHPAFQLPK
jgi:hypothetical protein